jgi:1-pyrroline-5-carboxylate dehydrogenase
MQLAAGFAPCADRGKSAIPISKGPSVPPTTLLAPPPFRNEKIRSFTGEADRASIAAAIERARARLGTRHEPIIDGRKLEAASEIRSLNPARPNEVVGIVGAATAEQAAEAVEAAARRFETWKRTSVAERAGAIFRAAELIRRRRDDFNALLVLEVGKPWVEADADTAEAIDFLEFYAREALRYADPRPLVPYAGEENRLAYIPLGAGVVIPPWNFAFAIMAGMTTAAIVTGNTVCLKPSEDASVVAAVFVDLLREAGVPDGVVNFVPGPGATVGEALVAHAKTRFISFTGSKAVGLRINEVASKVAPGQIWIKRVVAEMGGKDAIVVAADADLDAAADGIVASAFGFSGQKCSACSRAIVDAAVYDVVLAKVVERTKRLELGDPSLGPVDVGPVVNRKSVDKILGYIELGRSEGRLVLGGRSVPGEGYFVEPTIFADVPPEAAIAREEIFGPVVAFIKARDFSDALAIANGTEFGLTGAVYSRDEAKLELARTDFHVGNLYFNRKCTGALVGVHPFGGFNMSGTDSKAGGYDYLGLFLQAKIVSKRQTG